MNKKFLLMLILGLLAATKSADAWRGWGWGWGGWGPGWGWGSPWLGGWGWGLGWGYPWGYPYGYNYYQNPEAIRARAELDAQRRADRDMRNLNQQLMRMNNSLRQAEQDLVIAQNQGNTMRAQQIQIAIKSLKDQTNFTKQRILTMQQNSTQQSYYNPQTNS